MARFFQLLGIALLLAVTVALVVYYDYDGSIEGKWRCTEAGHFANVGVSPTGEGGTWTEIEFSDTHMILEFANGVVRSYPYSIIGDGKMVLEGSTLRYEIEAGDLHIYNGQDESVFCRSR